MILTHPRRSTAGFLCTTNACATGSLSSQDADNAYTYLNVANLSAGRVSIGGVFWHANI